MARYSGPMIDVDIHHNPASDAELAAYLPQKWRDYVAGNGRETFPVKPPNGRASAMLDNNARRGDSFPPGGGPPGSDYDLLREQLLDRYGYHRGLLTFDLGEYASHMNPYFAAAVCRAANDWNLERWLSRDPRLLSVAVVPSTDPTLAVEELRRVGRHQQIVGVLMSGNPMGRPWGDPHYHPIYAAAAEMGLVVMSHVSGGDRPRSMAAVGGPQATGIEHISQLGQGGMHYVSSFITHGVFEKFPTLQVLMVEYGVAWIPSLMWRLDREVRLLRLESPWVRRLPSDYIHDHFVFSTQPIEEGPTHSALIDLLETVDGIDDMLCYSSDYPHITMDDPMYVARLLPAAWHSKVFFENARRVLRIPAPAEAELAIAP